MRRHPPQSTASAATRLGLQIESAPHGGRPMKRASLILALLLPASLSAQSRLGATDGAAAIRSHRSGVDVRWENKVGRALSELAILATAREHDQPYEWSLHEMEAMAVGLEPAVIDVVRNRKPLAGIGDKETTIIELAREIAAHR